MFRFGYLLALPFPFNFFLQSSLLFKNPITSKGMCVIPYVCMKGLGAVRSVAFQLIPICRLMFLEIRVILPSQGSKKEYMNVQTFSLNPFNPLVTRSAFEGTLEHL